MENSKWEKIKKDGPQRKGKSDSRMQRGQKEGMKRIDRMIEKEQTGGKRNLTKRGYQRETNGRVSSGEKRRKEEKRGEKRRKEEKRRERRIN